MMARDEVVIVHGLRCKQCAHGHKPQSMEAEWGNPEEDYCPNCGEYTDHEVTA